jgi:acyl dehydratase
MPIDRDTAVGVRWPDQEFRWSSVDVRGYHRTIGWIDDRGAVLPTFAMTAPGMFGVASPEFYSSRPPEISFPGIQLNLASLLHREQEVAVHGPIPRRGALRSSGQVVDVEDRVSGAILVQRAALVDADGVRLITGTSRIRVRGERDPGKAHRSAMPTSGPDREPSAVVDTQTTADHAIRYQHYVYGSSMRDNVHTDPAFARAAGFPGPILQGVCTYGLVCAALVDAVLAGDTGRMRRYSARFLGTVFPGEALRTRMWVDRNNCVFATSVPERNNAPVLSGMLEMG